MLMNEHRLNSDQPESHSKLQAKRCGTLACSLKLLWLRWSGYFQHTWKLYFCTLQPYGSVANALNSDPIHNVEKANGQHSVHCWFIWGLLPAPQIIIICTPNTSGFHLSRFPGKHIQWPWMDMLFLLCFPEKKNNLPFVPIYI